jgi:hypothetical protein
VSSGSYGINSGTSGAIADAAKQVLTGNRDVGIIPLYGGIFPEWTISVRTVASETPSYDLATLQSEAVVNAVQKALPSGFVVYHQAVAALGFVLDNATLGILDQSALG